MNKRIPISGIIVPFMYFISALLMIFFNVTIHESIFNIIPIFGNSYLLVGLGIFCAIYSIILRRLFTKYRDVYIDFILVFALLVYSHKKRPHKFNFLIEQYT